MQGIKAFLSHRSELSKCIRSSRCPALRRNGFRALISLIIVFGVVISTVHINIGPMWSTTSPVAAADGANCSTSGPDTGAYLAQICITAPIEGATVSGDVQVTAEVTIESGVAPPIEYAQFFYSAASSSQTRPLIRDYTDPYRFTLPTARWKDRTSRLEVQIEFDDEYVSDRSSIVFTAGNGVSVAPVGTGRWIPHRVEGEGPVVVAAVGDSAGGLPGSYAVAEMIQGWNPDMFLYLGDIYNYGTYTEFINHYDPALGPMKAITNPVPGDHEGGSQFQGYRDYWDSNLQFYTTTAGAWNLISLDSTERSDQTAPGTTQFEWLREQLANDDNSGCTLVFFHEPRWALIFPEEYGYLDELWRLLVAEGVDLVVTGHEHKYERWTPLNSEGEPDASGPIEFVVGNGGHELLSSERSDPRVEVAYNGAGALRMELRPDGADYQFINTEGSTIDAGSMSCGEPAPVAEPETTVAGANTGTIVDTGGAGARCRLQPDLESGVIAVLPEGSTVELRGNSLGDWQPVVCVDRDGYVYRQFVAPINATAPKAGGNIVPIQSRNHLRIPAHLNWRREVTLQGPRSPGLPRSGPTGPARVLRTPC